MRRGQELELLLKRQAVQQALPATKEPLDGATIPELREFVGRWVESMLPQRDVTIAQSNQPLAL